MKTILAAICILFTAHAAFALSCMRPDALRLYLNAKESDDSYYLVKGRLMPEGPVNTPAKNGEMPKRSAETQVRLQGLALTQNSFSASFDQDITLRMTCVSIWCGAAPLEQEIFAAIKLAGQRLELEIGPCGFDAVEVVPGAEERILDCHAGGECAVEF